MQLSLPRYEKPTQGAQNARNIPSRTQDPQLRIQTVYWSSTNNFLFHQMQPIETRTNHFESVFRRNHDIHVRALARQMDDERNTAKTQAGGVALNLLLINDIMPTLSPLFRMF